MKVVSLNLWYGRLRAPLLDFLAAQAPTTDVFCFQEVFSGYEGAVLEDLIKTLPEFILHFAPTVRDLMMDQKPAPGVESGQAIFVRRSLSVVSESKVQLCGELGKIFLQDGEPDWPSLFHSVVVETSFGPYRVSHVHGIARPGLKTDTPLRLEQSQKIVAALRQEQVPTVLCGDFNLYPDTESVGLIERTPMRNLIKEFNITDTRGDMSRARWPEGIPQFFADYAFVSPEIMVRSFSVPQVAISDHLPLIVEVE